MVDTDAVCAAIKDVFEDTRSILEPAGAMGVAAVKQYVRAARYQRRVAGHHHLRRNMNFDRLRFVAERAEVGEEREAVVRGHDPRGAWQLPDVCARSSARRSVTEFNYRISDAKVAHVFVGIATVNRRIGRRIARTSPTMALPR